jgi:hypothetical protein
MILPPFKPNVRKVFSTFIEKLKPASGPLFFTTSLENAKGNVVSNGSYGLACTDKKWLLVTCHHVWNGFLEARKTNPELKLCASFGQKYPIQICTLPDGAKLEPIDLDRELDLATFDMTPFASELSDKHFAVLNYDIERQIKVKDLVAIVGYPGFLRIDIDEGLLFGREPFILFIHTIISRCKFRVDLTRAMSEDRELTVTETNKEYRLGGISGAPCFCLNSDFEPVLVGFVTNHIYQMDKPENYLQITTSNCINEDGTIKPANLFYGNAG